jgi:hypothetical protein
MNEAHDPVQLLEKIIRELIAIVLDGVPVRGVINLRLGQCEEAYARHSHPRDA